MECKFHMLCIYIHAMYTVYILAECIIQHVIIEIY